MIDLKPLTQQKINQIWQDYKDQPFCQAPPLSVGYVPENGIIFVGINPSISDEHRAHFLKGHTGEIEYYQLHEKHEGNHKYFWKFVDIAESLDMKWGHFDLLYLRETDQNKIEHLLHDPKGLDFIYRQLLVTKEVMDQLLKSEEPIIFVVNNTLARRFLGKDQANGSNVWMEYPFNWSEEYGTDFLGKHPFFFTSMLTGQRALDKGSFERLVWHIRFVKNRLQVNKV